MHRCAVVHFVALNLGLIGCATPPGETSAQDQEEQAFVVSVDLTGRAEFLATLPDGTQLGADAYADRMPGILAAEKAAGHQVTVSFGENISTALLAADSMTSLTTKPSETTASDTETYGTVSEPMVIWQGAGFTLTDGFGIRFLYGCISQTVPYYAIRLNYGSNKNSNFAQIFDAHFAKYWKPPLKCYGVYESASWRSLCFCTPNPTPPNPQAIKDELKQGMTLVGVGAAAAWAVAEAAGPYVLVGMAAL